MKTLTKKEHNHWWLAFVLKPPSLESTSPAVSLLLGTAAQAALQKFFSIFANRLRLQNYGRRKTDVKSLPPRFYFQNFVAYDSSL
ncbi:hypothetical protein KIN20_019396, partial [Parelaphostrongylus tenuis]